jgi:haloacetate dehalogenase
MGEPAKPALLLLHGFPQSHVMWQRVARLLAPHFFLVMPDLRGYGDSSKQAGLSDHSNYSKRALAQDAVAVMDALGGADESTADKDKKENAADKHAKDAYLKETQQILADWLALQPK